MSYSRAEFRNWLESLPQDEPFCDPHNCPIGTYLKVDPRMALIADASLVGRIDNLVSDKLTPWDWLRPNEVIAIIDRLEASR